MSRIIKGALVGALVVLASPGHASTFATQTFRCPVGGKSFTATVQMSSSSFGQRPDGKPYSTVLAPPPECPDNGFVFYQEKYSPAEQARLTVLVLSPEYRQLRAAENIYYRRYWLMKQMGEPADHLADAILVASWNSDEQPSAKARYQREYVAAAQALAPGTKDLFWFQARAADVLRELGEHARALALVADLEGRLTSISDADERKHRTEFLAAQRVLNGERNTAAEPVTLVPDMIAARLCVERARALSESEQAACAAPRLQGAIADYRTYRAQNAQPSKR